MTSHRKVKDGYNDKDGNDLGGQPGWPVVEVQIAVHACLSIFHSPFQSFGLNHFALTLTVK